MTTDRERWLRLSSLFDRAIDLDAAGRRALLDIECADDPALREELQRMLDADTADSAFDAGAQHVITRHGDDEDDGDGPAFDDDRLGVWRLEGQLGRGGMGTVHAAYRDDDTAQRAAIKRLRRRWDGSAQAQRFLQERRILAALSHSNIPRLLDHGLDTDGRPWFALEHVDGQPLTTAADTRKLGLRERVVLMLQVCAAVKHAHEHFVVHRDLKPSNILVDGDGHAKVLDFGVAKRVDDDDGQTRTGMAAGFTPEYAAPEQITGGTISAATDVHALGVLLYELLAGRLPHTFDSHDLRAAAEAISTGQAPRLEQAITTGSNADVSARLQARRTDVRAFRRYVRGDLGRILQTALAKEPQRRYASVQAFADDLRRFLDGCPVSVSGDTFGYRTRKFVQRNRWGVAMAVVAAIAIAAGIVGMGWQVREARWQRDAALAEAARSAAVREYVMLMFRNAADRPDASNLSARDVLAQGAEEIFKRYTEQPETGLLLATTIGELYMTLGDIEGAAPLYERILSWPGNEQFPAQRASAQKNLGTIEYFRSNPKRARELLDAAQAYWRTQPSRHRLDLLEGMVLQAQLERVEGKPEASIATLQHALQERRRLARGQPDRDSAQTAGNLSLSLLNAGRISEAKVMAEQAWAEYQALDLLSTSDGLGALNNLAVASLRLEDYATAERAARQVHETRLALFPVSQDTAVAQHNLALAIARQGRLREALPLYESALKMAIEQGGENGRAGLLIRPNLVDAYVGSGRQADALALAEDQVRIASAQYGAQSPFLGAGLRARAATRLAIGNTQGARDDLDRATDIFTAMGPGGEYPLIAVRALQAQLPPP